MPTQMAHARTKLKPKEAAMLAGEIQKPSWQSKNEGIHEKVSFEDSIWGFDLAGGSFYKTPLRVTAVKTDSRADKAGIRPGDKLLRINDIDTSTLTIQEAHTIIIESGVHLRLAVTAPEDTEDSYHCWEDELEAGYDSEEERRKEREKEERRHVHAKVSSYWSLQWPWVSKRRVIYRESNCFLVPSKYESKHKDKFTEQPLLKTTDDVVLFGNKDEKEQNYKPGKTPPQSPITNGVEDKKQNFPEHKKTESKPNGVNNKKTNFTENKKTEAKLNGVENKKQTFGKIDEEAEVSEANDEIIKEILNNNDGKGNQVDDDKVLDNILSETTDLVRPIAQNVPKVVENGLDLDSEEIIDEVSRSEELLNEVSHSEEELDAGTHSEDILHEVTHSEEILDEITHSEEILDEVTHSEDILDENTHSEEVLDEFTHTEEITHSEDILDEITHSEEILEEVSHLKEVLDQVTDSEQVIDELSKSEDFLEDVSHSEITNVTSHSEEILETSYSEQNELSEVTEKT